jgi:serine/threonine protein kinase
MKYIEANNVIHRDLALRNLLITKSSAGYCVKIGDLVNFLRNFSYLLQGLGRTLENSYYSTNGKPIPIKWSAPEVVLEGKFTIKSDAWSFGVVLWEIFSYGKVPYPAFSNEQVVDNIGKGYRMSKPEIMPSSVAELMASCWNAK